eukprot:GHVS01002822.1.p1 GENE.GHVS01002822.1~~GHVS01002822.1.p1  ORF type:complete len:272 (-),score=13.36 GHVS01002822.1:17-745(-)
MISFYQSSWMILCFVFLNLLSLAHLTFATKISYVILAVSKDCLGAVTSSGSIINDSTYIPPFRQNGPHDKLNIIYAAIDVFARGRFTNFFQSDDSFYLWKGIAKEREETFSQGGPNNIKLLPVELTEGHVSFIRSSSNGWDSVRYPASVVQGYLRADDDAKLDFVSRLDEWLEDNQTEAGTSHREDPWKNYKKPFSADKLYREGLEPLDADKLYRGVDLHKVRMSKIFSRLRAFNCATRKSP